MVKLGLLINYQKATEHKAPRAHFMTRTLILGRMLFLDTVLCKIPVSYILSPQGTDGLIMGHRYIHKHTQGCISGTV